MKVIIRTDSSFNIGTGHVVRSLALAQKLREQGINVSFACRLLEGNIISLIEEKQFKVIKLTAPITPVISDNIYDIWRGVSEDSEIDEFAETISSQIPEWIIVDHYSLSSKWEENVQKLGPKVFAIDDLYRRHFCEALLDQNTLQLAQKYQDLTPTNTSLFLGPQYALLSPSFLNLLPPQRDFSKVYRILAFFGGSDLTGETLKFASSIQGKMPEYQFDIVVGKINRSINQLSELCKNDSRIKLHIQTPYMADLMKASDLFVGAGGTTNWEKSYMGLPSICITTAENQIQIAKDLHQLQVHQYLGHWDQVDYEQVIESLTELISNKVMREAYSLNALKLGVGSKISEIYSCFK